jgi:hypothetical protein
VRCFNIPFSWYNRLLSLPYVSISWRNLRTISVYLVKGIIPVGKLDARGGDGVIDLVGDLAGEGVREPVGDGVREPVGDGVREPVGDGVREPVGDGVREPVGDDGMERVGDGDSTNDVGDNKLDMSNFVVKMGGSR